jgi:aminoglycoside 6'-N-acetyltransferase I
LEIEVRLVPEEEKQVFKNLYAYWRYDLMEFIREGAGSSFNVYGVLDGPNSRTHEEATQGEEAWWQKPGILFPFVIWHEGLPVGLAAVASPPHATRGRDYRMNDFWIARKYRRQGIGRQAAFALFDQFRGKWEVGQILENEAARAFWPRIISEYTNGDYEEVTLNDGIGDPDYPAQFFSNELKPELLLQR